MSPNLPKVCKNPVNRERNDGDILDIFGVRISPSYLEFKSAFEGKTYKHSLSIRNISKSKIVVRITSPTSYAYRVKPVKGQSLSPGLRLIRTVTYVFTFQTCASCILPIYIDDNRYDYQLFSTPACPKLNFSPKSINFGLIDAGCSSPIQNLVLSNDGDKIIRFYIDSTTTEEYTVIVDPLRGMLRAKQSTTVGVRIIANKEGKAVIDLWVKADDHYLVQVTADVIRAKLESISNCLATTFTLIDFPVTYVGLTSTKSTYIRNYSAYGAMYCLMGEVNNTMMNVETCREKQTDFKYFTVYPNSGMLQPREMKSMHFEFHPTKLTAGEEEQKFYFAVFHLFRIKSKYLSPDDLDQLLITDSSSATVSRCSWSSSATMTTEEMDTVILHSDVSLRTYQILKPVDESSIKFYLHGIAEKPSIVVIPDELILANVQVGQKETRILELRNNSYRLPIIFSYKKVACIDLNSPRTYVKPDSGVEVAVYITPHNIGTVITQIRFDLVFHDYPKTGDNYKVIGKIVVPVRFEAKAVSRVILPEINAGIRPNYVKETGKFCENLRFDTRVEGTKAAMVASHLVSKSSSALMALPNDVQRSLRPWRKNKCKTLFTKIPRYVAPPDPDYELTVFDQQVKGEVSSYYTNYVRQIAKKLKPWRPLTQSLSDYEVSPRAKLMCEDIKTLRLKESADASRMHCAVMHLSPICISNIIINPLVVYIGPMAPHNSQDFRINVRNKNKNPISVHIIPDKSNVMMRQDKAKIIKGNDKADFVGVYISSALGYYTTELRLILNDCALVVVYIIANVCPITLKLETDLIIFNEENTRQFLELTNPLSTDVCFKWSMNANNFSIEPPEGSVKGNSSLMCYVQYFPNQAGSTIVDANLSTGDLNTQHLRLMAKLASQKLFFATTKVHFKNIPLNISVYEKVLLRNDSEIPQPYELCENEMNRYIDIFPSHGLVYPNSFMVLVITAKLTACVVFSCKLKFTVGKSGFVELQVSGNVVYPDVVITPTVLSFKKICAGTSDFLKFTVTNNSEAIATVRFDMSMYPEFKIAETNKYCDVQTVGTIYLERNGSTHLYIRFAPYAITTDTFLLPIIINDILGPVVGLTAAKQVICYLTDNIPASTRTTIPKMLPITTVRCQATTAKICLSKTSINLSYAPVPTICKPAYELKIVNEQLEHEEELCIRTDKLDHPFYFTYLRGKEITQSEKVVVCNLQPKEEIVFEVAFRPNTIGIYKIILPIYLRSDNSNVPYNYLCITGTFSFPTITCMNPVIYFKVLPLKIHAFDTRKFIFENHFADCRVECMSPISEVEMEILKRLPTGKNTHELWIKTHCRPQRPLRENFTITIRCSCGGICDVVSYFTAENSFFTNYAFVYAFLLNTDRIEKLSKNISMGTMQTISLASMLDICKDTMEEYDLNQFFTSYPFFPDKNEEIYNFMDSCIKILENWIYTQGFNGRCFIKLPEGMAHIEVPIEDKKQKTKENLCIPPFIQLLINMMGEQMKQYFELQPAPSNELAVARYVYKLYKKALNFLVERGARFTCAFPEYMMPYSTYLIYVKHSTKENGADEVMIITDLTKFYRLSKQSWLNVMMQTYKVLVISQLIRPLEGLPAVFDKEGMPHYKFRHTIKNISKNNHLFSTTELLVLYWLEFHYNDVRESYWRNNPYLETKEVSYFGQNMEDGFVYAAVTLSYCPYLEDHFKKLCPHPDSNDELLHNNILVIQSWDILNFSMKITVTDLIKNHPFTALVISTYLFEVLPAMTPTEVLQFKVGLSLRQMKQLTIKNSNDFEVSYKAVLYGNTDGCFGIKQTQYLIQPKAKCKINLQYWAKFAKLSQCTLILSGECKGYRYAKGKVVTLMGEPDVTYVTMEMTLSIEMYKVHDVKLSVVAPTATAATYKVYYKTGPLASFEDIQNAPTKDDLLPFALPRFFPLETSVYFDSNGQGTLKVCTAAVTTVTINGWLFFRNADLGDFIIALVTVPKLMATPEVLQVVLPAADGEINETCKRKSEIFIEIPRQNRMMWKSVIEMLFRVCTDDIKFWKDNMGTTTGMHILQRLIRFISLSQTYEMCETIEFEVTVDKNCNVVLPSTIRIEDACDSNPIKIKLQFMDKRNPRNFLLLLKSQNQQIRYHRVNFVHLPKSGSKN